MKPTNEPDTGPTLQGKLAAAFALFQGGDNDQVEKMCNEIVQTPPVQQVHGEAMHLLGLVALRRGDYSGALNRLEVAAAILPTHAGIYSNKGNVLVELGRVEDAIENLNTAIKLSPGFTDAFNNLGIALRTLGRHEEALASFDRVLSLDPNYADAHYNRGNLLRALNRPQEAVESYQRAVQIRPDYADAHWNQSICHLLMGDFEAGFQLYEWRWRAPKLGKRRRNFAQPLWLGESPIAGKTILLHAEQGYGDTIQFCRYAKPLAQQGAKVILEVQPELLSLLKNLDGPDKVISRGDVIPEFDVHCPMLSLPLAMKTRLETIPTESAYIRVAPGHAATWLAKLGETTKPRIGLVWSGSPGNGNDKNRSIPLAKFPELLSLDADFISLQKEVREDDMVTLNQHRNLRQFGPELNSFLDTAALIANVDLVISVDTAVAHLAGAMGKQVWVLLPFSPDWRWLLGREDSPWYLSLKLFRQRKIGDWTSIISSAKQELVQLSTHA